ncbi:hypothetical protein B0H15DRAFT_781218, partial [Mycena belliarum]
MQITSAVVGASCPCHHPSFVFVFVLVPSLTRPADHVVATVAATVDFALSRAPGTPSPYHAPFAAFVATLLSRAETTPPTLLTALTYVARARPHLVVSAEEWARERVFLGALMAASKYAHDSALRNAHWALCTPAFGRRDVARVEREFLAVVDWQLAVRADEL